MSEGTVPGSPHEVSNKTMVRNIIAGIITTVVGGSLIYFLGFHTAGGSSEGNFLVTKEATMNGWRSYVSAENVFFSNWSIYMANYSTTGFAHYKEATLNELNNFKSDLKKILSTKNIDPSLASLLERRIKAKEQWEVKYRKHLDNYEMLLNTIADQTERTNKINNELGRFQNEVKEIDQLFASEIGELCNTLTSKYGYTFSWNELKMYQQQTNTNNNNTTDNNNSGNQNGGTGTVGSRSFVGKWQTQSNGSIAGTLYLYENGRMYYYFQSGDSTYGRWQYNNDQITLFYDQYYGAGYNFIYNITNVTGNSFTMTFTGQGANVFNAVRMD